MRLLLPLLTLLLSATSTASGVEASFLQTPLSSARLCKCAFESLDAKPKDWVAGFNNLTTQLTELVVPTKELDSQNAFFVIAREGPFPVVLDKVVKIVNEAETLLEELDFEKPLKKGSDSDSVLEAYRAATKAALFWSNIMSSKSNDFKGSNIYQPVGALGESALRAILDVFESLGFLVTEYLVDELADVQESASALSRGFDTAIIEYGLIKSGTA